jgi:hypothetical protein
MHLTDDNLCIFQTLGIYLRVNVEDRQELYLMSLKKYLYNQN